MNRQPKLRRSFTAAALSALSIGAILIGTTPAQAAPEKPRTPDIVGGGYVTQAPSWAVSVGGCTASLISPRWVITAAHCVSAGASGYSVRVGSANLDSGGTVARVSRTIVAPGYGWPNADLALLELATSVPQAPVRLADPGDVRDNQAVTIYGWGVEQADWSGPRSETLKYATGYIKQTDCAVDSWYAAVTPRMVCTQTTGSSAGGDSGGPAIVADSSGQAIHVGVNSASSKPSGDGRTGFTSTAKFRDWIRSTTGV